MAVGFYAKRTEVEVRGQKAVLLEFWRERRGQQGTLIGGDRGHLVNDLDQVVGKGGGIALVRGVEALSGEAQQQLTENLLDRFSVIARYDAGGFYQVELVAHTSGTVYKVRDRICVER